MEHIIVDSLKNLQLTKEEEEDIFISSNSSPDLPKECALSLFEKLLVDRNQKSKSPKEHSEINMEDEFGSSNS